MFLEDEIETCFISDEGFAFRGVVDVDEIDGHLVGRDADSLAEKGLKRLVVERGVEFDLAYVELVVAIVERYWEESWFTLCRHEREGGERERGVLEEVERDRERDGSRGSVGSTPWIYRKAVGVEGNYGILLRSCLGTKD